MNTNELLEKVGLTKNQAMVYTALLKMKSATGYALAKRTGMKRATTYLTLEGLEHERLVHKTIRRQKLYFTPEPPDSLLRSLNKKTELVKRALPELVHIFNTGGHKPSLELFEGKEGIKEALDRIIDSTTIKLFGSSKIASAIYPEALGVFIKRVQEQKITVQDILPKNSAENEYIKTLGQYQNYQIRLSEEKLHPQSDFALSSDSLYIFTYQPEIYCICIKNIDIVSMFEKFFNLAWKSATQI